MRTILKLILSILLFSSLVSCGAGSSNNIFIVPGASATPVFMGDELYFIAAGTYACWDSSLAQVLTEHLVKDTWYLILETGSNNTYGVTYRLKVGTFTGCWVPAYFGTVEMNPNVSLYTPDMDTWCAIDMNYFEPLTPTLYVHQGIYYRVLQIVYNSTFKDQMYRLMVETSMDCWVPRGSNQYLLPATKTPESSTNPIIGGGAGSASTATFTPTFTPTSSFTPTFTPTSSFTPTITTTARSGNFTFRQAGNCRSGPGTVYPVLSSAPAGAVVPVDGKNSAGDWLRLKLNDSILCWVRTSLGVFDGNLASLVIYPDPPTPTATDFPAPVASDTPAPMVVCSNYSDQASCDAHPECLWQTSPASGFGMCKPK